MNHPIRDALVSAQSKAVKLVHNAQQTKTAAYVDDKRVLVFGDAYFNEVLGFGNITHYRGYEPFPVDFDSQLQPCVSPTKPGPFARKFTKAINEVNSLRTRLVKKPNERLALLLKGAVARAEKLKRIVTYLGK